MDESTRPSLPEPDSVTSVPEAVSSEDEDGPSDLEHLSDAHRESVRRLRRRVEQAAATIERLRAENRRLRERVEELESQPAFPEAETVFTLDDDPEEVKERISRFIDAIDTYLDASADDSAADEDDESSDAPNA
ncbi:MAG TPA: cell division protein ZapB [Salinibacter sp.]|nr:cell division protein ZapB [Salinibacter sp.]